MKTIKDAYEALKGDLNNSYELKGGDNFLYWDNEDRTYTTFQGKMPRRTLQYICTVEEFNNYKGENMIKSNEDIGKTKGAANDSFMLRKAEDHIVKLTVELKEKEFAVMEHVRRCQFYEQIVKNLTIFK